MPYRIIKVQGGYELRGVTGKLYGKHSSKAAARAQIAAINASKKRHRKKG